MYFTKAGSPHWQPITEELRSADMPLRRWLSAKLPNTDQCFADFRKAFRCKCIEPPAGVPPGTAGAAFDYLLRYTLGTGDPADLAVGGTVFAPQTRGWAPVVVDLAAELLHTADRWKSSTRCAQSTPPTVLLRGCWALALLTELFRGVPVERSPLATVGSAPTPVALLELAPEAAIDDLVRFYSNASNTLFPFVSQRNGGVIIGPTFSKRIPGDADLIKGRKLVEFKASVDRRTRDGTPRYSLGARTLYQVVTYGLLDRRLLG